MGCTPTEEELFLSSTLYDVLNRPIQLVAPHAGSETDVIQPGYNEANLLEKLDVWLKYAGEPAELLRPDTTDQHFVTNIDYNAKGQRMLIQYGNDAETRYHYDPATFRLVHLYIRCGVSYSDDCGNDPVYYPAPDMSPQDTPCGLQNLHYTYDPVGNITSIRDDAQHTIYFNGEVVRPDAEYKYDAIYRLIEACGREHIGQASEPQATWHDRHRINLAHPNDGQAMRNYFEFYEYDEVGNILKFDHKAHSGNWIRAYEYDEPSLIELDKKSNRLSCTIVHPNGNHPISEPYTYDLHGNMTSMPHLPQMVWDFKDQMQMVDKGGGCMAYYVYDAGGQRVRKVIEQDGRRQKERFYIGGFEVYRKYNGSGADVTLERETLHVMDGQQRIAMVETRTQGDDPSPQQLMRYHFSNHLGSASLELDSEAQVISHEEYYPYGNTSYQAVRSQTETSKRYRYTGMERDEETGLNYHSARYYAPWLSRWTSVDPAIVSGQAGQRPDQPYQYVENRPTVAVDPDGRVILPLVAAIVVIGALTIVGNANAPANEEQTQNAEPSVSDLEATTRTAVLGMSMAVGGGTGNAILQGTGSKVLAGMGGGATAGGLGAPADLLASDVSRSEMSSGSEYTSRTLYGVGGGALFGGAFGGGSRLLFGRATPPPGGFGWRNAFGIRAQPSIYHIGGSGNSPRGSVTNPTCRGALCVADVGAHEANLVRPQGTSPITNEEFIRASGRTIDIITDPIENATAAKAFLNAGFSGLRRSGRITQSIVAETATITESVEQGTYLLAIRGSGGGHALHSTVSKEILGTSYRTQVGGRFLSRTQAEDLMDDGVSVIQRTIRAESLVDPQVGSMPRPPSLSDILFRLVFRR